MNIKIQKSIIKLADKINVEVAEFFGVEPIKYNIVIYKNKEELGKEYTKHREDRHKAPDWLVAFADINQTIYLTSPDTMPATSTMTGRQRFKKTLKHELSHLYLRKMNNHISAWLNEGTALHVAEQDNYKKIELSTITVAILNEIYELGMDSRVYDFGKNLVDEIVNNFGKQKLLDIIAIQGKNELFSELQKMFKWLK